MAASAPSLSTAWDVLVVGGGHAGCEAALAAARLGARTLLVTGSLDRIAAMSCNPAVGGVGKGHLVKELDALGGEMARVADATGIHFRTLNESRGPAVRATRCQSDMDKYAAAMRAIVQTQPGLSLRQDDVVGLLLEEPAAGSAASPRVVGVRGRLSGELMARRVVLTTGTFLGGRLHLGANVGPGGRAGEAPAEGLSASLASLGLRLGRLKTGTCPRLDRESLDLDRLERQPPDDPAPRFAWHADWDRPRAAPPLPQVECHITRTNEQTHAVIQRAVEADASPLFNGQLGGQGPRYCPSVEDKVVRFAEKTSHHIFVEPQGLDSREIYPNGLSTSLPPEVQVAFLRTIPGFEQAAVTRFGYAVEYDFVDPTQLGPSLAVRTAPGLYCAGQLNGTTGYEEAAMQGFLAGVNAVRSLEQGRAPVVLGRHEGYGGVLVDDLITKGTTEPYRMLTSRAEHRLILREDNVHGRLSNWANEIGLVSGEQKRSVAEFEDQVASEVARIESTRLAPSPAVAGLLHEHGSAPLEGPTPLAQILRRPEIDAHLLAQLEDRGERAAGMVEARAAVEVKYAGYIARAAQQIERERALDDTPLGPALYRELEDERWPGLSLEVYEKLVARKPETLGQASRIPGVTPAAVGLLAAHAERLRRAS